MRGALARTLQNPSWPSTTSTTHYTGSTWWSWETTRRRTEGTARAAIRRRAESSPKWRFQLANVIWHCYKASRNDAALSFDIDSVLRRKALRGARLGVGARASSGAYWLHLPWYFANVSREGLAGISNGIDDYMLARMAANATHRVVRVPGSSGAVSLDVENIDYPWRQFADGMWHGANGSLRRAGPREALREAALAMGKAAAYQRPHVARGWLWAVRHQDSEACRAARGTDLAGWITLGTKYVRDREWGREGTGF